MLERIVVDRIVKHLEKRGPNIHEEQYGFRRARSTIDAILRVRAFAEDAIKQGRVVIGVALDITNAFNSLPWDRIGRALETHRVPLYLRRIVKSYLMDRSLVFQDSTGMRVTRAVCRGVPQGSVLGPLLWNLGYDSVLRDTELPLDCLMVCYADDTFLVAAGGSWETARLRANEALEGTVEQIALLDLRVAPEKSEAIGFQGRKGRRKPPNLDVRVAGRSVPVKNTLKYLGLILDSQ